MNVVYRIYIFKSGKLAKIPTGIPDSMIPVCDIELIFSER